MIGIPTPALIKISLVSAVLAASGLYAYTWHNTAVDEAVTNAKNALLVDQQKQTIKLLARQHEVNSALNILIHERNKKYAKDIDDLNRKHVAAIASMRNRPSRTIVRTETVVVADTRDAEVTAGCYPEQLFREDAELVINIATDAEQVRLALLKCYYDYDSVKKILEDFTKNK